MIRAAGVILVAEDTNRALFLRSATSGLWELPGGRRERGERPIDTALAELHEETGFTPDAPLRLVTTTWRDPPGVEYSTFEATSRGEFVPRLSEEHTEFAWRYPSLGPEPMQPGLRALLKPWYAP